MMRKLVVVAILAVFVFPTVGLDTCGDANGEIEYLPIFCQAEKDRSELLAVYCYQMGNLTQFTLVFSDEYYPVWLIDKIYRVFRILRYHRTADIETFYIRIDENSSPVEVIFSHDGKGTYSGEQSYDVLFPKHYSETVPFEDFECNESRPYIYINTWNHLFSEKKNGSISYVELRDYTVIHGDRGKAEEDYRIW